MASVNTESFTKDISTIGDVQQGPGKPYQPRGAFTKMTKSLYADPVGRGRVKLGAMNHEGYNQNDPNDFYRHFVIELTPNKVHSWRGWSGALSNCNGKNPRVDNGNIWWNALYGQYQLPRNFNVMYSRNKDGSGNVSHRETLLLDRNNGDVFDMVRWNYQDGHDRPYFVSFPLPASGSGAEDMVWIDLSWPIRAIYFPVAHSYGPNNKGWACMTQIDFKGLEVCWPHSEMGPNVQTYQVPCSPQYGINLPGYVMRLNVKYLMRALLIDSNDRSQDVFSTGIMLSPRWDVVPYTWDKAYHSYSNYSVGVRERWVHQMAPGSQYYGFMANLKFEYVDPPPSFLAGLAQQVVGMALGLVPGVGPLLAFSSDLLIDILANPGKGKELLTAEGLAVGLVGAVLESALGMDDMVKTDKKKPRSGISKSGGGISKSGGGPASTEIPVVGGGEEEAAKYRGAKAPDAKELGPKSESGPPSAEEGKEAAV